MKLRTATASTWVEPVLADFDAFLIDHAACERKASATGMGFVVRYPDRPVLVDEMIGFAREELEHFHQVYRIIRERGLQLAADTKDQYVGALRREAAGKGEARLLDHLLIAAVVEARGCERFRLVAEALAERDDPLAAFYLEITRSEGRHQGLFVRLAQHFFHRDRVTERLDYWLTLEASVVSTLPSRAALH
ncbi:MAG: tRNA-(ms[2]io[6]A)-hydroxylase [Myxococcota bacterium]